MDAHQAERTVKPTLPPSYVNTPVLVAYAGIDDAVLVTMIRILGLCWAHDYEHTPALVPEQLAIFTGRSRSAFYRHLKALREMDWLRVEQVGRRIIIRPTLGRATAEPLRRKATDVPRPADEPTPNEVLLQALADIGIGNPKRAQLARMDIDPVWVWAWHLWARHPHRGGLTNPIGNIILKLESREPPPSEFLRQAEEHLRLREWEQEREESVGQESEENDPPEPELDRALGEARQLWATSLGELQLQMTRATFDTWLRGSQVIEANEGHLTIAVRHAYAVDWLQNRLLPVVKRTVQRHARGEVEITFVAKV
jgi:DNA-binding transcriptional ArsR family regulator